MANNLRMHNPYIMNTSNNFSIWTLIEISLKCFQCAIGIFENWDRESLGSWAMINNLHTIFAWSEAAATISFMTDVYAATIRERRLNNSGVYLLHTYLRPLLQYCACKQLHAQVYKWLMVGGAAASILEWLLAISVSTVQQRLTKSGIWSSKYGMHHSPI